MLDTPTLVHELHAYLTLKGWNTTNLQLDPASVGDMFFTINLGAPDNTTNYYVTVGMFETDILLGLYRDINDSDLDELLTPINDHCYEIIHNWLTEQLSWVMNESPIIQ